MLGRRWGLDNTIFIKGDEVEQPFTFAITTRARIELVLRTLGLMGPFQVTLDEVSAVRTIYRLQNPRLI